MGGRPQSDHPFFMLRFFALLFLCSFVPAAQNSALKNDLLGKFDPGNHPDFDLIAAEYTEKNNIYMRKEAYRAFKQMYHDAAKCGIKLKVLSATRNFDYQKGIWERKWNAKENAKFSGAQRCAHIMRYSSMPGTSRHHWGTDIDLCALDNAYFATGAGKKTYDWLCTFGPDYGFGQTYTDKKSGRTGYEEEKWHWSYRPSADSLLQEYDRLITYDDLRGYAGAEFAREVRAIEDFVKGVD